MVTVEGIWFDHVHIMDETIYVSLRTDQFYSYAEQTGLPQQRKEDRIQNIYIYIYIYIYMIPRKDIHYE